MHLYLETERLIVRQYMLNDIDELVGIMSDIRACLVSSENNTNKSKRKHLKRIMKKSFTVFPKSAAFIKPAKGAFHNPALRNNRKIMEFIAFNHFNFRT